MWESLKKLLRNLFGKQDKIIINEKKQFQVRLEETQDLPILSNGKDEHNEKSEGKLNAQEDTSFEEIKNSTDDFVNIEINTNIKTNNEINDLNVESILSEVESYISDNHIEPENFEFKKNNGFQNEKNDETEIIQVVGKENNRDEIITQVDHTYEFYDFSNKSIESVRAYLIDKLNSDKLIGIDLLQIINNEDLKKKIHEKAMMALMVNYTRLEYSYVYKEDIIISLIIIALESYDGNFWPHVQDIYSSVYKGKSSQKIDKIIRTIISSFGSKEDNRQINYVIRNTIVPKFYIQDFISFAFDVYKDIFRYSIPKNIGEILVLVYKDVSKNYDKLTGDASDSVKTYKLIKTTKEIIQKETYLTELIAYTLIILNYIDYYYWKDRDFDGLYPEYFQQQFEIWSENNEEIFKLGKKRKGRKSNIWNSTLSLHKTDIILSTSVLNISKIDDIHSLKLTVLNDNEVLQVFDKLRVKKIIGGYQIDSEKFKIDKPLHNLKYIIEDENNKLYDSEDTLYRNYLLFTDEGSEVRTKNSFFGNLTIVSDELENNNKIEVYYASPYYQIGSTYIEKYGSIKIGEFTVLFYDEKETRINGEKYNGVNILFGPQKFALFKKVYSISFTSQYTEEQIILAVNDKHYHLHNALLTKNYQNYYYCVELQDYVTNGFNFIVLKSKDDKTIVSFKLFIDDSYQFAVQNDQDGNLFGDIHSVFITETCIAAKRNGNKLFEIPFNNKKFESTLLFVPDFTRPIYRIGKFNWNLFSEIINVKDIDVYSKIQIDGIKANEAKLISLSGDEIAKLDIIESDGNHYITTEKIIQFGSDDKSRAIVMFYNNGIPQDAIHIYYKAVLNEKTYISNFEEEKSLLHIYFEYDGKDIVTVEMVKEDDSTIYCGKYESSPVEIEISNVNILEKYKLFIYGGEKNIFSSNTQYLMNKPEFFRCYSQNDIRGRWCKIDSCTIQRYYKDNPLEKDVVLKNTFLYIDSLIHEDLYSGIIQFKKKKLEVEVEILTSINNGQFSCLLTEKDDGGSLLFDYRNKTVCFEDTEDTKTSAEIIEYDSELIEDYKVPI